MASILIAEDEERIRRIIALLLCEQKHDVVDVSSGEAALAALERRKADLLLLDVKLPGIDGFEVLRRIRERPDPPASVLLTAYGTIPSAVEAIRLGAFDYVTKPFHNEHLLRVVERGLELRRTSTDVETQPAEEEPTSGFREIIGVSPAIRQVFRIMAKVAQVKATTLITGESGTGKELVARAIHLRSPRTAEKFVAVNCSAIPQNLVESEFFGHEKGAFTDAHARRLGRFEEANGGSLFLDEVGDLAADAQAKLLRTLQDQQITPVGGKQRQLDVRVIAATNKDLAQEVREGRFRADLFWRLNVVPIQLPPLRERKEDLVPLCNHFLARFNRELGLEIQTISCEARNLLLAYDWPGNIRELENAICRSMVLCDGHELKASDLPIRIHRGEITGTQPPELNNLTLIEATREATERVEKKLIATRLAQHGWNRTAASESLGISRKTLFNKLRQYGLPSS